MNKKVFCSKCKNYKQELQGDYPCYIERCKVRVYIGYDYLGDVYDNLCPEIDNENNNCQFYEERLTLIDRIKKWLR